MRLDTIAAISLIIFCTGILTFAIYKSESKCDSVVTFVDGTTIQATRVNSFECGMTHIHACDGSSIEVPTIRIKMVERLDSAE
jgi:hypothetical protein